jgi:hypothetical protein
VNKLKETTKKVQKVVVKVTTMLWVLSIGALGLAVLDIITLPSVIFRAYGIGLLITATVALYKSIK